jgi:hypothetical protein
MVALVLQRDVRRVNMLQETCSSTVYTAAVALGVAGVADVC